MNENKNNNVEHPKHYGGADNPYEAIKVIEAWNLGFHLGNTLKYISRAGKKDSTKTVEYLEKALWYAKRYVETYTGFDYHRDFIIDKNYNNVNAIVEAWNLSKYDMAQYHLCNAVNAIYDFAVYQSVIFVERIVVCIEAAILKLKEKIN